jgi:hypothetical protein
MRRIVMENLEHDAPLAVYQDGGDELWIVNAQYATDLKTVVDAAENLLREIDQRPLALPAHLRLLRWMLRPVCRHIHCCVD